MTDPHGPYKTEQSMLSGDINPAYTPLEALNAMSDAGATRASFVSAGERYVILQGDLKKMLTMGLDTLPIESIGVPEDAPTLETHKKTLQNSLDLSRKLTQYFPGHMVAALYEFQSLAKTGNFKAFLIGGNVRDILLLDTRKLSVPDVDITIEGDAIATSQFIVANSKNFVVDAIYPEFGTAKINYKGRIEFDLASTRREIYPNCGALPEVLERGVPLSEDITRRDFTSNALAMSIHNLGEILDYTNGIVDIENRVIRVLHPLSFFEDPSRILRALKFLSRLDFKMVPATKRLLQQFLKYGGSVYNGGGERIKDELCEFLSGEPSLVKHEWIRYYLNMGGLRLTNMSLPQTPPPLETMESITRLHEHEPLLSETLRELNQPDRLWKMHLCLLFRTFPDELFNETAHRLGLRKSIRDSFEKFRQYQQQAIKQGYNSIFASFTSDASPDAIDDLFRGKPFTVILASAIFDYGDDPEHLKEFLQAFHTFKTKYEPLKSELNGNDLIELGIKEGTNVGESLKRLRHEKLQGRLPNRMAEVRFVQLELLPQKQDSESKSENNVIPLMRKPTEEPSS